MEEQLSKIVECLKGIGVSLALLIILLGLGITMIVFFIAARGRFD